MLLNGLNATLKSIELRDKSLLALDSVRLGTTLHQGVLLFSGLFQDSKTRLLTLLNIRPNLHIVFLELSLNQLKVLIEAVPQFIQTLFDLSFDFLLQPQCEGVISIILVALTVVYRLL